MIDEYIMRQANHADTVPSIQGVAAVEAAVTVLLFFVLLFAVLEAGRLLNVKNVITDAAREGARVSVAPLSRSSILMSVQDIQNVVNGYLQSAAISGATVTIERPVLIQTGSVQTQYTRVTVRVPYRVLTLAMFSSLQITLSAEALMRNETSP